MTTTEAVEYLSQLGLSLPAPVLTAVVAKATSVDACMTSNGYSSTDQELVRYYLTGLLAISSGGRRVKSQSSPSGASQSYSYAEDQNEMRKLKNNIRILDPNGCATALIPAEPGPTAALYVVSGRSCSTPSNTDPVFTDGGDPLSE